MSQSKTSLVDRIAKSLSMGANAVVIAGIIVAFIQFYYAKRSEKVQNAINAVNETRSRDFLQAYTRLKTASESKKPADTTTLIDDLNYVMNTYDSIALLYINGLADRCVIRNGTYAASKEMSSISKSMSYPTEYRANFDRFVALMETNPCE